MSKTIVVDSDSIFAIYNPNDPLNHEATETFQKLIDKGYLFIYPSSVIFEIISLFQRVLPLPTITTKLIDIIRKDEILVYVVDNNILRASADLFNPNGSKKNTLIDCSVAIIAKKIKADAVFSYDNFYIKEKLTLAKDLIKKDLS